MEKELQQLLSQLTLDEKIKLCHGESCTQIAGIPRLNIKPFVMNDGPQGVRMEDGRTATALPCGLALAAAFSPELAYEYGALIARECNFNRINAILGPGFNLMRTPMNGRNFEYFGEDPVLAGTIAAGYIKGCQAEKVAAVPKHLALNNQEICRTTGDSICDLRTLRELYLRAFEIVVEQAQPWMMMSSYNKINGTYASAHEYVQNTVMKQEVGFDGVMVSDWGGLHDVAAAVKYGTDLEMGSQHFAAELKELISNGTLPEALLDKMVIRILRLLWRSGCIPHSDFTAGKAESETPEHRQLAKKIAAAGTVLLKNDARILPLKLNKLKRILVTGPNADYLHSMGGLENCGGSGAVHPEYEITPLVGIREACGEQVEVVYTPGVLFEDSEKISDAMLHSPDGGQGVKATYFDGDNFNGQPFLTRCEASLNAQWGVFLAAGRKNDDALNTRLFSVRLEADIVPEESAIVYLTFNTARLYGRVLLDGKEILSNKICHPYPEQGGVNLPFEAGKSYRITVEMTRFVDDFAEFRLLWCKPWQKQVAQAVELAKTADCVLFFGGRTHRYDREAIGWGDVPNADIGTWDLPAHQNELLAALCAEATPVIGCFTAGAAFNVQPWINDISAMLHTFYGGMEAGRAVAGVLLGSLPPQGRLPFTWGKNYLDYSCHANGCYPGVRGEDNPHTVYKEGLYIGYRYFDHAGITPQFPFGFGLSYTAKPEWRLVNVQVNTSGTLPKIKAEITVTNHSNQAVNDVVQIYIRRPQDTVERPAKVLAAWQRMALNPAETKTFNVELDGREAAYYDIEQAQWVVPAGEYAILLASDANCIVDQQGFQL